MNDPGLPPGPVRPAPGFVAHSPFLLAASREWHLGYGVADILNPPADGDITSAAARFLASSDDTSVPPVLIGALPFASGAPSHLYRPARWLVTLPDNAIIRAGFQATSGNRVPTAWSVTPEPAKADYAKSVAAALELLESQTESLRKVVISRSLVLRADAPIPIHDVVTRLLSDRTVTTFVVPLPPCATGGRRALVGATPELLLSRRSEIVRSMPLAGSARRSSDAIEDTRAANALLGSEKDRREHAVVIEWIADRLTPYCRSLRVPRSPSLVSTATMWHLATDIHGELRDRATSSLELARTLHPTPAVCGLPAARAAALIHELESFDRRFYTGAVGWCDRSGDGDWYVAIRCADICGHVAHLYAGAGIVAGSSPDEEVAETSAKFMAILHALHPTYAGDVA